MHYQPHELPSSRLAVKTILCSSSSEIVELENIPSKSVKSGSTARFTCGLLQGEQVKFTWIRNGNVLTSTERIRVNVEDDTSTLVIRRTIPQDAGNYTCIAKNAFSENRVSTQLEVQGEFPGVT